MKHFIYTLAILCAAAIPASAQINFLEDGSSITTGNIGGGGDLTNVTVVQAAGSATENGTALKAAMDAITNDGEGGVADVTTVIQLAAGTYDLGANTLTLKPNTLMRGVGRIASIITGQADPIMDNVGTGDLDGHDIVMRDLQVKVTTAGTGIYLDNAAYLECWRIAIVMDVTGGVDSIGVEINNAEMDLSASYLTGDPHNSGGSVTLLDVTNGEAYLINSGTDSVEESTDGALTGIATHTGAEVDIVGGDYIVEREDEGTVIASLSDVTLFDVGANSRVNVKNAELKAWVFGSDGQKNGITLANSGGFTAFATWFDGTFPTVEFFNSGTDGLSYYQCFGGGVGEM